MTFDIAWARVANVTANLAPFVLAGLQPGKRL